MHDDATRDRFIELRARDWSFDRLVRELNVSKPTLLNWSRLFQSEIQNARAIHQEALREKHLPSPEARLQALGKHIELVEAELGKRDLSSLPTWRLVSLAAALRREAARSAGQPQFSIPESLLPDFERNTNLHEWQA